MHLKFISSKLRKLFCIVYLKPSFKLAFQVHFSVSNLESRTPTHNLVPDYKLKNTDYKINLKIRIKVCRYGIESALSGQSVWRWSSPVV